MPEFNVTGETKLSDIEKQYPWLKEEHKKIDPRFKMIDSPLAKFLIKSNTVASAAQKAGVSEELIIEKLREMVEKHG